MISSFFPLFGIIISSVSACSPGANQYLATFHSTLPWKSEYGNPSSAERKIWDQTIKDEVDKKLAQDSVARSYFSSVFVSSVHPNASLTDVSVTITLQRPVGPTEVLSFIYGLLQNGNLVGLIPVKPGIDLSDSQSFTDGAGRSSGSSNFKTLCLNSLLLMITILAFAPSCN